MATWTETVYNNTAISNEVYSDNYYLTEYLISGNLIISEQYIVYSDIDDTDAADMPKELTTTKTGYATITNNGGTGHIYDPYHLSEHYEYTETTVGDSAVRYGTMVDGDDFRVSVYDVVTTRVTVSYSRDSQYTLYYNVETGIVYDTDSETISNPTQDFGIQAKTTYININGIDIGYQDAQNDTDIIITPAMCTARGQKAVIWSVAKPAKEQMEWYLWYADQLYEGPVYPCTVGDRPEASITDATDEVLALGTPVTYGIGRMGTIKRVF